MALLIKLARFGVVGWLTAMVYFISLYILIDALQLDKIASSCISYILAISINYILHYMWTFDSEERHKIALFGYIRNSQRMIINSGLAI